MKNELRIVWLAGELGYTSGAGNHNQIFINYLKRHPDVEKISIVRWPTPIKKILSPERQILDGIEIYSPRIQLKMKTAIESFKKAKLNFKEKLKFDLLRFGLKLKGFSKYDSTKFRKLGIMGIVTIALLTLEKPFPNPFLKSMSKCIEKINPDIIQSQQEFISIPGAVARDHAKAHFSTQMTLEGAIEETKEGTLNREFTNRFLDALKWLIESDKVDIFLPITVSVKDYLLKYGVTQNKMRIISSPIVIENFPLINKEVAREKLGLPSNKKIILSVGRMTERKRFQDIVEILRKLPENVILYIKKSSSLSDDMASTLKDLKSLIKKHKLTNRVIINEKDIPYDQMVYIYSACDVAVYPFIDEPFGMCVAEAMACNLPLIVYNSGFLPNFIDKNGYVVEPLDYEDLYQKTKLILDDERLASEMGQQGREMAQQYDINILGEKLVNLYKEFL